MQEVPSRREEVVALQKELSRLQEILKQREEVIEKNKHNTTRLQREIDSLHKQVNTLKITNWPVWVLRPERKHGVSMSLVVFFLCVQLKGVCEVSGERTHV